MQGEWPGAIQLITLPAKGARLFFDPFGPLPIVPVAGVVIPTS